MSATAGGRILRSPNYNEILPRLYLGDIATAINREELTRLGITDMITIEIRPLQQSELASCIKRYLFINVMDHPKQDILSHFEASNEFIETALKNPCNKVYVHCVAGISRSASLVIAYIMKTRSMNYGEAHEMVVQKRKIIDPNEGFVKQLTLYYRMKYGIDIGNLEYRRVVLDALVFEFRLIALSYFQTCPTKCPPGSGSNAAISESATMDGTSLQPAGSLILASPTIIQMPGQAHKKMANKANIGVLFDQYYNKLHLQQVSQFPIIYNPQSAFKCNKCRTTIFYAISVIENKLDPQLHGSNPSTSTNSLKGKTLLEFISSRTDTDRNKDKDCPYIYIEPQPWMSKDILDRDGKLRCYKCKRKLGTFDWTGNEGCSCARHNSHINYNLFRIMRKKVDPGLMDWPNNK